MASNVSAQAFIPEIWDAAVWRTLEDNLVAKKICYMKPTSQVKGFGDTVYFNGLADPAVNAYTGTVTYETLQDSTVALHIDTQKYYAFKVSDIESAMANVDLKGSQAERAAYMLKDSCDADILSVYGDAAAGTVTDATTDSASILSDIALAGRYLDEVNVTDGQRWIILPPWCKEKLVLAGVKFQINNGTNGKGGMSWCEYLGFDVYISNNLTSVNPGTATVQTFGMAGSYNSIAYAEKLMKSETIRLEGSFNDGIRGLLVYGKKVVKPGELVKLDLTRADETAI